MHATKGTVEGAQKGAALLCKLEEMHRSGESGFKPGAFLRCVYQLHRSMFSVYNIDSLPMDVFHSIDPLDIILYNKLINAWRLCEQSNNDESISPAEMAQEILDSICEKCEVGGGGGDELVPNDVSFSLVIHAWCKSNRPDAPERAEKLLRRKEEFAEKFSNIRILPSDYTPIISKWRDDPAKGAERATLLFEDVLVRYGNSEEVRSRPTAATLNALLDVYAKCHERNLADSAERCLERMKRSHDEGRGCILPDVVSYRSVMDAWIRSWDRDSPRRVHALVNEMIRLHAVEGRDDLRPDTNSFNLILKACSTSPAMWGGMKDDVDGHPIAIANRTFTTLRGKNEYGATATHATYSFMFNTYRQHMDFRDKRYPTLMRNLWRHCCRDGLASQFSLDSFRSSVLERDFWRAIGGRSNKLDRLNAEDVTVKDLPAEWSRNVTPMKRPKRYE